MRFSQRNHTVKTNCPACGLEIDAATCLDHQAAPRAGDCSVCIRCAAILTFVDQAGHVRKPTLAEFMEFRSNPKVQVIRAAILAQKHLVN